MKQYMVIETFKAGCLDKVYARFHEQGRLLPEGQCYLNSWLEQGGNRCFQLMETNDQTLFPQWTRLWDDIVAYEIIEIGEKPQQ